MLPLKSPKTRKTLISNPEQQKAFLRAEAAAQGFAALRITPADNPAFRRAGENLRQALTEGRLANMAYMNKNVDRRADPRVLWPEVRSLIMLGFNYGPNSDPRTALGQKDCAAISVYARNRDYHDVIKGRLKHIASRFSAYSGAKVKVFVDTAPVMEKPLAQAAGLGFQGKHTNLVSRDFGSWLFLGSIFTTAELPADKEERNHCGSCCACLNACPTGAFPAPFKLDANRCISYLTIECKGEIPIAFRAAMGNRIYGCDDCLAACPWNKFAQTTQEAKLQARHDLQNPPLYQFLTMTESEFRLFFSGSPIKRIGHHRFMRNVLIACGNSNDKQFINPIKPLLTANSPLIRGAAIWALSRLLGKKALQLLEAEFYKHETDLYVQQEWEYAISL